MRELKDMEVIQIDITNYCNRNCSNCTRMVGHYRKDQIYFMDLSFFEKAVISLIDFKGIIGIIGGEPTLHPEFEKICEILSKHVPKERRGLWSYMKYEDLSVIAKETFSLHSLNDKNREVYHTPILVSSESVVIDNKERNEYFDKCWIQNTWSATINPKGGWFCEVAGAFSMLFDGPDGMDITDKNWWKRPIDNFKKQKEWACNKCGAAIPLKPRLDVENIDDISVDNYEKLKNQSDKIKKGRTEIFNGEIDRSQIRNVCWHYNYKNIIKK